MYDRLVPADAYLGVTAQPIALLNVLNLLDQGIIFLDSRCHPLWSNTVFAATIRADPEGNRILTETLRLAAAVATADEPLSSRQSVAQALSVARADVCTRFARYALRATRLGRDTAFTERPFDVVVSMARAIPRVPGTDMLVDRFGLTPSEATVALLLARGMSNRDIARTLSVSAHTARHHTESVLLKLHVHTRAAVGGVLLDAEWPARPDHAITRPADLHADAPSAGRDW